jgi:hypothetical protein
MAIAAEIWADLDDDAAARARRFHRFYRAFGAAVAPLTVLLYLRLRVRSPAGLRWLRRGGFGTWRALYAIVAARFVRRALRARGAPAPAVVWPLAMPAGCIIAFFHTPWDRVIARELRDREYCLIRAGRSWAQDLGGQRVGWDSVGLASLVRRVSRGARCAVAADNFVSDTEGGFFGTRLALNPAAVRLAAATGAPLVTLWPTYDRGVLRFELGRPIAAATCAELPGDALRAASRFFEDAVRRDLVGWPRVVSFVERSADKLG